MSAAAVLPATADASGPKVRRFRTDIQALRALAIVIVVLNHLWPTRFGGGYVGVDVFFVISGYLITAHLFGELAETGRIRLGRFYARRIRRLLPAALLVLAVSAVLVVFFLPFTRWMRNAAEIAASAAYVENWLLASFAVNYSASTDAASVAQHYWSLSVEEQFYILWPLLLVGSASMILRRRDDARLRSGLLIVVVVVAVLSFIGSVVYTATSPSQAYFATFTRGWEFAAGGIIALAVPWIRMPSRMANTLALAGFAAIVYSVFTFSATTVFPGASALIPVLGTAAIIVAGTGGVRLWHARISATAPVQWLGGISYSLYLWHWPLIVIAPFALQREVSGWTRVALFAVAIVLAWVTKLLVEDRGQSWTFWKTSTPRAFALMAVGMAIVMAMSGGLAAAGQARTAEESPTAALTGDPCAGPRALESPESCDQPFGPAESVVMTPKNEYFYTPPECSDLMDELSYGDKKTTRVCDFSRGEPSAEVWLVGDSHAQQWQGAIFDLARERQWRLTISYFGGCPAADVDFFGFQGPWGAPDVEACRQWSRDVSAAVAQAAPEIVFTSMAARQQLVDDGSGRPALAQFVDGLRADWAAWTAAGSRVMVLGDSPLNVGVRSADCVLLSRDAPQECARPRAEAQPPDPLMAAAADGAVAGVVAVDMTDQFCDETLCYAVVGGVPVYFDGDHLNLEYVRMLAPEIARALDAAETGAPPE